tara:strand:+ start:10746 stop:10928 length:183 start_codon:yes stop_codon:yes gene_type:complete
MNKEIEMREYRILWLDYDWACQREHYLMADSEEDAVVRFKGKLAFKRFKPTVVEVEEVVK